MTSVRQLPAREAIKLGVGLPYWQIDMDKPIQYHLTLILLTREELDRAVIMARHYAAKNCPVENDPRDHLNYTPTDRERVNFLRHSGLNRTCRNLTAMNGYFNSYDNVMFKIEKKGIDIVERQRQFKLQVLIMIAQHYPHLALECEQQAFNLTLKGA
jgi:hypothetical protein